MSEATGRILKGDDVKLEGRFHLDVARAEQSLPREGNTASGPARVCIVEKHPDFAVIEMTCSCGSKTYLKCEYAGTETSSEGSQLAPAETEIEDHQEENAGPVASD